MWFNGAWINSLAKYGDEEENHSNIDGKQCSNFVKRKYFLLTRDVEFNVVKALDNFNLRFLFKCGKGIYQ